jgi:hypothetical protein
LDVSNQVRERDLVERSRHAVAIVAGKDDLGTNEIRCGADRPCDGQAKTPDQRENEFLQFISSSSSQKQVVAAWRFDQSRVPRQRLQPPTAPSSALPNIAPANTPQPMTDFKFSRLFVLKVVAG